MSFLPKNDVFPWEEYHRITTKLLIAKIEDQGEEESETAFWQYFEHGYIEFLREDERKNEGAIQSIVLRCIALYCGQRTSWRLESNTPEKNLPSKVAL